LAATGEFFDKVLFSFDLKYGIRSGVQLWGDGADLSKPRRDAKNICDDLSILNDINSNFEALRAVEVSDILN
jgi:hypothetical protein